MPQSTTEKRTTPLLLQPYGDRPYFGKFQIVSGKHNEGGVTYFKGEVVNSKSDLNSHNSAGSMKFKEMPKDAIADVIPVAVEKQVEIEEETIVETSSNLSELYSEYPNIDSMTLSDLEGVAEIEEIELISGSKATKLNFIKTTFAARHGAD